MCHIQFVRNGSTHIEDAAIAIIAMALHDRLITKAQAMTLLGPGVVAIELVLCNDYALPVAAFDRYTIPLPGTNSSNKRRTH